MNWDDENKASEVEETANREKSKKSKKIWVWGAISFIAVLLVTYWVFWDNSGPTQTATITTPSTSRPTVTAPEVVYAPNTSKDCPGTLSDLTPLSVEVTFNPKGCAFYYRGKGTARFAGLFVGTYDVNLETGTGSMDNMKVYTARSAGGPVLWQYILCAGPKKDLSKLDCS